MKTVSVVIIDDDAWEPDEDFYVELYDFETKEVLKGSDTVCVITIIDDDKKGVLSLEATEIYSNETDEMVILKVLRNDGCNGTVKCKYETEAQDDDNASAPYADYVPKTGVLIF
jgi:hypothetical protein